MEQKGVEGSSPHTRGARLLRHDVRPGGGIIPAYAGSTTMRACSARSGADHPRIRGEHGGVHMIVVDRPGSSPHTRGAHHRQHRHGDRMGIIPAYAGSTTPPTKSPSKPEDHPRIRGEHISCSRFVPAIMGSSPHTRGALAASLAVESTEGIIPAYAGSTKKERMVADEAKDHPRIRGEHPARSRGHHEIQGSSPHTRGARA